MSIKLLKSHLKKIKVFREFKYYFDLLRTEIPFRELYKFNKIKLFLMCRRYSMNDYSSLSTIHDLSKIINKEKISGNFVECGCCNGGAGAMATKYLKDRDFWLFDCFEGLPMPTDFDVKNDNGINAKELWKPEWDKGSVEKVKELYFRKLKMREGKIRIIKGLFQKTVPECKNKINKIALLHLDGDWYESTKVCIENLFDKVEKGGFIVVDDYGHWRGCKKAIDEFLEKRKLKYTINKIDYTRIFFRKM